MQLKDLLISPQNVRMGRNLDQIDSLGASIEKHSLINKLVLRPRKKDGKYEVVAGQRRLAALKELNGEDAELEDTDFVIIYDLDDDNAFLLSLQENQQRVDLSPMELHQAAVRLNRMGYNEKEIASALNVTPYRLKRLMTLSQSIGRLPEKAKEELQKPLEHSKFNDAHVLKMKDVDDPEMVKDVVDFIVDHETPPKDVPSVIKGIQKQHENSERQDQPKQGKPGEVNSSEPIPDEPVEYAHKGELKLEIHGDEKKLKVIGKGEEAEVPIDHYLEYLAHPEKFKCYVTFKLRVKSVD